MNSSLFFTKIRVPKLDSSYTNHFKSTYEFLSFQCRFFGLDENTTNHDYFDFKVCPYKLWDGILMCRF
jgi:hypothetical protein